MVRNLNLFKSELLFRIAQTKCFVLISKIFQLLRFFAIEFTLVPLCECCSECYAVTHLLQWPIKSGLF